MERLVESLGITRLSKSQVSTMAAELDAHMADFRARPLDAGPYTFVAADALVLKAREGGRIANVHALVATGVSTDGHREISACRWPAARTAPAGPRCYATSPPVACPASGSSPARPTAALVDAVGATLPGTSWQRSSASLLAGGTFPLVHLRRRERTLAA